MERKLTEKEKLLLGESFNPEGKELINQRTIAHGLCAEYNAASELDEVRRKDILNCLLGELAEMHSFRDRYNWITAFVHLLATGHISTLT